MHSEHLCKPYERYLHAIAYLSDYTIKSWQQNCKILMANKQKDEFFFRFINWRKKENEVALVTLYTYDEITIPKKFDCIFHYNNPEQFVIANYTITQSIFEAQLPIGYLERGCKHVCVLEFENVVPDILNKLHFEQHKLLQLPSDHLDIGLCNEADLDEINKRHKKVSLLKQFYGNEYLSYDEEY